MEGHPINVVTEPIMWDLVAQLRVDEVQLISCRVCGALSSITPSDFSSKLTHEAWHRRGH